MKKKIISYSLILLLSILIGLSGYFMYTGEISTQREGVPQATIEVEESKKPTQEFSLGEERQVVKNKKTAVNKTVMFLESPEKTYNIGEEFSINVYADANGEIVDGIEFVLEYDPQKVSLKNPADGRFFTTYLKNEIDNIKGSVKFIALQGVDVEEKMNKVLLASYTVEPLQAGTIEISINEQKSSVAAYGGQELLGEVESLTISLK